MNAKNEDNVAHPPRWEEQYRTLRYPVVFFSILGPASLLLAATGAGNSLFFLMLAMVGFGGSGYSFSILSWRFSGPRLAHIDVLGTDVSALVVRRWKAVTLLRIIGLGLLSPLFVALAIEGADAFGNAPPDGTLAYTIVHVIVFLAPICLFLLGMLFFGYVVGRVLSKLRPIGVAMTSEGIYHWWYAGSSFFPWREITDIELMPPVVGPQVKIIASRYDYPGWPVESRIGRKTSIRRWIRKMDLGPLLTHPGIVYQALFFYLRNPELRDELGDERSAERMKEGDYGEIPTEIETHGRALRPDEVSTP